jgi:putative phage-type endonuclease
MAARSASAAFADHCEWTGVSAHNREIWLITRRTGVGGSDVAAILGESPWRSALEVYTDKISADPPDDEASEMADWGHDFEPLILKRFAQRAGRRVVRHGRLLRSKRAAHHLVTLDGVQLSKPPLPGCKGPGVAEAKSTAYADDYADDLPLWVQIQIQWELCVTGAQWGSGVWLPLRERKLQWLDVSADLEFQEEVLIPAVEEFWSRVQRRAPPDPDGSDSSLRALRRLYPTEDPARILRLNEPAFALSEEYERNKAWIKLLDGRNKLIRNTLAATMRDAKYALCGPNGHHWRTAVVPPKTKHCPHCQGELGKVAGYKSYTFCPPRKKPFPALLETRDLVVQLAPDESDLLERQLAESAVGTSAPSNDAMEEAAS